MKKIKVKIEGMLSGYYYLFTFMYTQIFFKVVQWFENRKYFNRF